jgi:hypothetical protein
VSSEFARVATIERGIRIFTLLVLACALVATLEVVREFGRERFFTVDEYQYGHATWLVSQGEKPYVDFYEHHLPLSYGLHSLVLPDGGSFVDRALLLRTISFTYLLFLSVVLGAAGFAVMGNAYAAGLLTFLPLAFGFGLMSAIDYRADNFAACLFTACLALLEANRGRPRRATAMASGALFALALFMTQKMVFLGGGAIALLIGCDLVRSWIRPERRKGAPFVAHPGWFFAVAGALTAAFLCAGALLGLLPAAYETTVLHTLEHEVQYPSVRFWKYAAPFFAETRFTTIPILAFAGVFLVSGRSGFWAAPLGVAIAGGALMRAQYPYNYVYAGYLLVVCAVRGYAFVLERFRPGRGRVVALWPLLYLVPLAVLPDQLGFVANTSSNEHQLRLLQKIEAFTAEDDAVIDGAGGALFRKHGSYYWYHGGAHRKMFREYFAEELIQDYRRSRALFWIRDFRQRKLPKPVKAYFSRHYVHADGDLYALGFVTPPTRDEAAVQIVDVIRAGDHHVLTVEVTPRGGRIAGSRRPGSSGLAIDGVEVPGGRVHLDVGRHRVEVGPHSTGYVVSPLPPQVFERRIQRGKPHSSLFEYAARKRAANIE